MPPSSPLALGWLYPRAATVPKTKLGTVADVAWFAGRSAARLGWRWRAPLTPIYTAGVVALVGSVLNLAHPSYWWVPIAAGLTIAPPLWLFGSRMSAPLQRMVLALIPSAMDDGKKGVLDRQTERTYLAGLILVITGWLSWIGQHGWDQFTGNVYLAMTAASAIPWWWHRRIRRSVNRYVRRHSVIAENIKGYEGSRASLVHADKRVTVLAVRLAPSKTVEHVGGKALELASAYGIRMGGVTVSAKDESARTVYHRIVPRDPWQAFIPHPMPPIGSVTMKDPHVMIGKLEDGTDLVHRLDQHLIAVGQSGSGKSVLLDTLLAWLTLASTVDCRIIGIDMASGVSLGEWEPVLAAPLATNAKDALVLLEGVMNVITAREKILKQRKLKNWVPTEQEPWLFVVIDEFPSLIRNSSMVDLLVVIAERARKTGVWLYLAAQNGSKADLGSTELRAQMMCTIGLRLDRHMSGLLWSDAAKQGWDSTPLRKGTLLLRDDQHNEPRVAKGVFTTDAQREGLIKAVSRKGCVPLDGDTALALLGDSAKSQAIEAPRGQLTLVRDKPLTETTRRSLDELAEQVFEQLPEPGESGRRVSYLMQDLDISRDQLNRALSRLGDRVTRPARGEWTRS